MLVRVASVAFVAAVLAGCAGEGGVNEEGRRVFQPARILVQPDGGILLVGIGRRVGEGYECGGEGPEITEFMAVRLLGSGKIRSTSTLPQAKVDDWCAEAVEEAALLPRGGFALGGSVRGLPKSEGSGNRGFVAARFAADGSLAESVPATHPTTQVAGWLLGRPPPLDSVGPEIVGFAPLPRGGLALGRFLDGLPNYELYRVDRRGRQRGKTGVKTPTATRLLTVEADSRGVYVLTEEQPAGERADYRYRLYRHRPSGKLDRTFGKAGAVQIDPQESMFEIATDAVLQRDGRIVAVGQLDRGRSRFLYVVRRTTDGGPDPSWGRGGIVMRPLGRLRTDDNLYANAKAAVGVLADGRIVVAASVAGRPPKVFRFLRDGRPDIRFGRGGAVNLPRL